MDRLTDLFDVVYEALQEGYTVSQVAHMYAVSVEMVQGVSECFSCWA